MMFEVEDEKMSERTIAVVSLGCFFMGRGEEATVAIVFVLSLWPYGAPCTTQVLAKCSQSRQPRVLLTTWNCGAW